jgi:hypothetical protein
MSEAYLGGSWTPEDGFLVLPRISPYPSSDFVIVFRCDDSLAVYSSDNMSTRVVIDTLLDASEKLVVNQGYGHQPAQLRDEKAV